ncbi:Nramp family divalent metal transporter [Ascidiimonas sp. W6]|uniref:Nramp family divalent metal transporter n=1 Tax=Ascidiimonas meishanensis TaxID=3128903 RepID=UPI0030EBEBE0
MKSLFKKLGPGLLFAGAAIGVSHLVQSTRAGADFGFGLLWALFLVNIFKYPFFQYGPKYALATGENLLDGYKKLGKGFLIAYLIITMATMFTIQTAVTIVTAGLASQLFGIFDNVIVWSVLIVFVCLIILLLGKYKVLDQLIKYVIVTLAISTILAVFLASGNQRPALTLTQVFPQGTAEVAFLIAFMGWMPAPLDISIWHSLWALEKKKTLTSYKSKAGLQDFNVGYVGTLVLGVCFLSLGAFIMHGSGEAFGSGASTFAAQLITMYTVNMGDWAYVVIALAAFTTMFSTTITTLDASPRAMAHTSKLLYPNSKFTGYLFWILVLSIGTSVIFIFFLSEMKLLIEIATILSFVTAPFYAIANYILITSKHTPKEHHPGLFMRILSITGILFLSGFSIWYLLTL